MSFILNNQIFDKIHHVWINGEEISNSYVPLTTIEITAESEDTTDDRGNIIRRTFITKYYTILGNKNAVIEVNENGIDHLLCCTGMGWRNRPHKNKRIAKKWMKKYGKRYCYCSVNVIIKGYLTIQ